MKKILVVSLLLMFGFCTYAEARTKYDETGRKVIYDNTIRGRKRAAEAEKIKEQKIQAAAAAKLDYEAMLKTLETPKPKTNFYQDRILEEDYNYNY